MPLDNKTQQIYTTLKGGGADVGTEQEFNDYFFAKGDQGYKNRLEVWRALKGGGADVGKNYEEFRDWLGLRATSKPAAPRQAAAPTQPRQAAVAQERRQRQKQMFLNTPTTSARQQTAQTQQPAQPVNPFTPTPTFDTRPYYQRMDEDVAIEQGRQAQTSSNPENIHAQVAVVRGQQAEAKRKKSEYERRGITTEEGVKTAQRMEDFVRATQGDAEAAERSGLKASMEQMRDQIDYANATGEALRPAADLPWNSLQQQYDAEGNPVFDENGDPVMTSEHIFEAPTLARDKNGNIQYGPDGKPLIGRTHDEGRVKAYAQMEEQTYNSELSQALRDRDRLEQELEAERQKGFAWVDPFGKVHYKDKEQSDKVNTLLAAYKQADERIKALHTEQAGGNRGFINGIISAATDVDTYTLGFSNIGDTYELLRVSEKVKKGETLTDAERQLLRSTMGNQQAQAKLDESSNRLYRAGRMSFEMLPFMAQIMATGGFSGVAAIGSKAGAKMATAYAKKFGEKALLNRINMGIIRGTGVALGDVAAGFASANTTGLLNTMNDAMQRRIGQLGLDEDGNYEFTDDEDWWRAIMKAEASQTKEFATERFGEHLPNLRQMNVWFAKRGAGARKISRALSGIAGTRAMQKTARWLRKGGINGVGGEILEEEIGLPVDVALGDQTWEEAFGAKNQGDIIGGMFLSVGAMHGLGLVGQGTGRAYKSIQYHRYKRRTDRADAAASSVLSDEKWEPLKERIDGTSNDDIGTLMDTVLADKNYTKEEKRAVYDYMNALMTERGFNLGIMSGATARQQAMQGEDMGEEGGGEVTPSRVSSIQRSETVGANGKQWTVATADDSGNPIEEKTFDTEEEAIAYEGELMMRRQHQDFNDALEMATNPAAQETSSAVDAYLSSIGVDHTSDNYDEVIAAISDPNSELGQQFKQFKEDKALSNQAAIAQFEEDHGWEAGTVKWLSEQDPMELDNESLQMADEARAFLETLAYPPTEVHVEHEKQKGAEVGKAVVEQVVSPDAAIDPADNAGQQMVAELDAARQAYDELMKRNEELAQEVNSRLAMGMSEQEVVSSLDTFRPEDVQTVIDYFNANARYNGFMEEASKQIDAVVSRNTSRRTFRGTINGAADVSNLYTVTDESGNSYTLVSGNVSTDADGRVTDSDSGLVIGVDAEGNFVQLGDKNLTLQASGMTVEQYAAGERARLEEAVTEAIDAGGALREQGGNADVEAGAKDTGGDEAPATTPAAEGAAEEPAEGPTGGPAGEAAGTGATGKATIESVTDKDGIKRYENGIDIDEAITDIVNDGLDVDEVADASIAEAQEIIDKINSKERKTRKDLVERRKAQDAIDYYNSLKERYADANAEEPQEATVEPEGEPSGTVAGTTGQPIQPEQPVEEAPEWRYDTPEAARKRGYKVIEGNRVDRQEEKPMPQGKEVEVQYSTKDKVKGHLTVSELDDVQGSHLTNGQRNEKHFMPEVQPKSEFGADRQAAAQTNASEENFRPELTLTFNDTQSAYTGSASQTNRRKEIIQGHGRRNLAEYIYAPGNEAVARIYKDYLKAHAEELGTTAEEIEQMEKPFAHIVLDVSDEEAIRLGQFTAQDLESGGKKVPEVSSTVTKLGDRYGAFANIVLKHEDPDASLSERIEANAEAAITWLNGAGVINNTEAKTLLEDKALARQFVKDMVTDTLFKGAKPELRTMFYELPKNIQSAIISVVGREVGLNSGQSILKDIQESIMAFHELSATSEQFGKVQGATFEKRYAAATSAVNDWLRQINMDGTVNSEKFSTFALTLAKLYKSLRDQKTLAGRLRDYYDLVSGATRELGMFEEATSTGPVSREEAIKQIFGIDYGRQRTVSLAGDNQGSEEGGEGSSGTTEGGEREPEGSGPADAGRGDTGDAGNQLIPESQRRILTNEEIDEILDALEDKAVPQTSIPYDKSEWERLFKNPIQTPAGLVRMGEHQFGKLHPDGNEQHQDRRGWIGQIYDTLTSPDLIVEQNAPEDGAERDYKYVFVKSFINSNGESVTYFTSVTVKKGGMEVVVTNHFKKYKDIRNLLKKGKLCFSSISPSGMQTETNQPLSSATTSETDIDAGVSNGKDNNKSNTKQGNQGKSLPREEYLTSHPLTEAQIMADTEATEDEKLNAIDFLKGEDDSAISRFYYDSIYNRAQKAEAKPKPAGKAAGTTADPLQAMERAANAFREEQKAKDQQDIDNALDEFNKFLDDAKGSNVLDKFMRKGLEGNDKAQTNLLDAFTLTNEAQRMFLKDLLRLASKVGYAYIKSGVHNVHDWNTKMWASVGKKLKEVLGWDDYIVSEFVDEVWNQKYTVDGVRMRLSEHAERLKGSSAKYNKGDVVTFWNSTHTSKLQGTITAVRQTESFGAEYDVASKLSTDNGPGRGVTTRDHVYTILEGQIVSRDAKGEDNAVNVNKKENNEAEKPLSLQEETAGKPAGTVANLEGDSAEFAERQKKIDTLKADIRRELKTLVMNGGKPHPMSFYKELAERGGVSNLSNTDLQELVEAEVVAYARELASEKGKTDKQKYDQIVMLYQMQPSLNARDNDRINLQQYSTPAPMAFLMGLFAKPAVNGRAQWQGLEPSAGNGMLTINLPKEGMHVNDIDEMRLSNLQKQGFGQVTSQDGTQPFEPKAYDVVVTNPPFGNVTPKVYDGLYEISGLEHQMAINALESMKDDGRAAIIIGGNTEYNTNGTIKGKDRVFLNYLYSHYNVVDVINMDGKTLYSRQGTGYPVRMILINGRKEFDKNSFAPVQSKARADVVRSYDELYKRVEDDILRNKEHNGDSPVSVHPAESGKNGGLSDKGHAGSPNEKGVRGVRSGERPGEHQLPTEPVVSVQRGGLSPEAGGGQGPSQSETDGGVGTRPVLLHGRGNQPEQSGGSQAVPSGNGTGEMAVGGSDSQRLPGNAVDSGARLSVEQPEHKRELGEEKVPYRKQSQNAFDLQSKMPAEQSDVVKKALEELGDVDQFLVDELGYSSKEELYRALAAEQIDSVALAISQMKKGDAFIIGDQTGIGKGRQGAALIRWAVKNGKAPVYFTAKPELFSSVYRDIKDIHSSGLRPFILASDKVKARITERNKEGEDVVLFDLPSDKEQKRVLDYINKNGKLPPEYDFMITTYSQVGNGTMEYENGQKKARTFGKNKSATKADVNGQGKRDAIEALAGSSIVIMDESHLAGGASARGNYLQYISTKASGITYISATFAKRPDNMPLYSLRTAISKAGVEIGELIDAVKRGGATFQEIMSKALTEAGQMIRRERDMRGVSVDWRGIEDETVIQKHYEQYDKVIGLFNDIISFQRTYVDPIVNGMNDAEAEVQGSVDHTPGTRDMGINNTPFASQTHNIVKQVLLSLKAEEGAKFAVECLKRGEKPVICVENTNEGAADRAVGNSEDEDMVMPDLSVNLKKGLRGTLRITKRDAFGNEQKAEIPFESLSPEGQARYREIMDAIENASTGLSLSPIDVIKNHIQKAGYSVAELTGRKKEFVYNEDGTVKRVNRTDTDNKKNAADFNSGKIDAVIINKSAGTGIDLHAGIKFDNTDQRHMITVQAQSDINDEVQMRGRTDRTGQKQHSKYTYIVSTIPSEQRLLMMLKSKLRSLDANTTSSQKSKFNEMQVQDIINKYGDDIVIQYLAEHPDIAVKLVDPLKWTQKFGEGFDTMPSETLASGIGIERGESGSIASKVLGRMALLTVREQEKMLNEIGELYQAEIDRLNEMGENDLEITEMPLKTKTLSKDVWEQGTEPGGNNPFADNSYVERVQMDVLKKPMKGDEVKGSQERLLGGKTWEDFKKETMAKVDEWAEQKKKETTETITARAKKKAEAERDKYIKGAKKAQEKNQMTDEQIEHNGQLQYNHVYDEEMKKLENAIDGIESQREVFEVALDTFSTDGVYALPMNIYDLGSMTFEPGFGKLIDVKISSNFSPNSSTLTFATLDGRRKITVPINGKVKQQNNEKRDLFPVITTLTAQTRNGMFGSNVSNTLKVLSQDINNWDRLTSTAARKEGYIITGNLLKALVSTREQGVGGKLISFTTDTGEVRQGILMPDNFDPSGLTSKTPISSKKEDLRYYRGKVESADGDVTVRVTNEYDWRDNGYNTLELVVPGSNKRGSKYFNDKVLLSLMNGQFEGKTKMKAEFKRENLDAVMSRLDELGVTVKEEKPAGNAAGTGRRYDMDIEEGEDVERLNTVTQQQTERSERIAEHVDGLVEKLGTKGRTTVYHSFDELPEKDKAFVRNAERQGKKVRGWYENGRVFLYLPHIDSIYQAEKTIWHETVAHHGLRQLIGEENLNKLLTHLWLTHKDGDMGKWVTERMTRNGWSLNEAIEEYLAREAEKHPFEQPSLWQRVRWMVADALRKIGFKSDPTISDIQYLLWLNQNRLNDNDPLMKMKQQAFVHRLERAAALQPHTQQEVGLNATGRRNDASAPIFVSNALDAVAGIKQEKATPEQWLKMIEKNGGLKAGEDKWMGLSDWLNQRKTAGHGGSITKQEVLDFIRENQIQVEEVNYSEAPSASYGRESLTVDEVPEAMRQPMTTLNDRFKELVQERRKDIPELWKARNEAYDTLLGEYGQDFADAFGVRGGELVVRNAGQLQNAGSLLGVDVVDKNINPTRLKYTTSGLHNKKEIALVVPTVESWNEGDEIHFGDAGEGRAVAWVRFGETTDADGKKVLVIDEIQSKRHQEGRERGYKDESKVDNLKQEYKEAQNALKEAYNKADKFRDEDGNLMDDAEGYDDAMQEIDNASMRMRELEEELRLARRSYDDAIPDAPFEKNWHELAMKRMLRYAAENGYDKVAWTKGEQQAERYNLAKTIPSITRQDTKKAADKGIKVFAMDINGEPEKIFVDNDGIITNTTLLMDDVSGKPLSDFVGKEIAIRMMSMNDGETIDTSKEKVGGEGMKGFYDQMLPRFIDKYGKKWGVKTGEVELPDVEEAGRKMWSVDVTPEMKKSVMQGQRLFDMDIDEPVGEGIKRVYEETMDTKAYVFTEAFQDAMLALKVFMNSALKKGEQVLDSQNAYMAENLMHGKSKNEMDLFNEEHRKGIERVVNEILNKMGWGMREMNIYLMTKSGLERNRELYVRDWLERERRKKIRKYEDLRAAERALYDAKEQQITQDFDDGLIDEEEKNKRLAQALIDAHDEFIDSIENDWHTAKDDAYADLMLDKTNYAEYLDALATFIKKNINARYEPSKHDYSGLTEMYGDADGKYDEKDIIDQIVEDETAMNDSPDGDIVDVTYVLWSRIGAANKYALERYREAGMRTDEQIDKIEQMFHFYVPMRGFDKDMGEDVYQYFTSKTHANSYVGGLIKHAKGRRSMANSPLSTMFAMAYKAISDCNQNRVKQHFYRFCQAHPNDLIVMDDAWVKLNEVTGEWEEVWPDIPEDATDDQVRDAVKAFDDEMRQLASEDKAKKINGKGSFDYKPIDKRHKDEHTIEVMINGKKKLMTVVGNPRVAQAINGHTKWENGKNIISKINAYIKNKMSAAFTSYSPTFAMRNMLRDWTHFAMMLNSREGAGYTKAALNYYRETLPRPFHGKKRHGADKGKRKMGMKELFWRYREGLLDMDHEVERDFKDFMDNGGVTGYVHMQKVDKLEKEIQKLVGDPTTSDRIVDKLRLRKVVEWNNKLWNAILGIVEAYNEAVENNARFATYRASRHYAGRTKARSAYDAKEITVNFNRKGSGSKVYGFKSDKNDVNLAAQTAGVTSQVLGEGKIFFNATIQAIANTFKGFKNPDGTLNKKYIAKWAGKYALPPFAFGLLLPYINQALFAMIGGDDDDPYANLPEWTRRKNICFYVGNNNFVTIPVGQELAAFLALGDIVAANLYAPDLKPVDKDWVDEMEGVMNTFSPIDIDTKITKGGFLENPMSETVGRISSVLAPVIAVEQNLSWTGRPIYKEDRFTDDEFNPEYQMVYQSTNPLLVATSKYLHELGGGNDRARGKEWSEVNPAIIQYLWEQYTGGPGKVFANTISMGKDAKDLIGQLADEKPIDTDFNMRKVEGPKAFFQQGDDRTQFYRVQAKFFKYQHDADKFKHDHDLSTLEKNAKKDPFAKLELEKLEKTAGYQRYKILKEANRSNKKEHKVGMDELRKEIKNTTDRAEKREMQRVYNYQMEGIVDLLDKVPE